MHFGFLRWSPAVMEFVSSCRDAESLHVEVTVVCTAQDPFGASKSFNFGSFPVPWAASSHKVHFVVKYFRIVAGTCLLPPGLFLSYSAVSQLPFQLVWCQYWFGLLRMVLKNSHFQSCALPMLSLKWAVLGALFHPGRMPVPALRNHRVTQWFGLQGDLEDHPLPAPAMDVAIMSRQTRLAPVLY